ncbi:hypothetical protein K0M31_006773 [Melipona bicolor]|uniref:Uncharacterized protein n=1 Tax=Melipona bicolor TaxID=60889 RepID=A0AA40KLD3_9HYME|nr:hypothetical protein K0M31_006773 [Melipona bicolor]
MPETTPGVGLSQGHIGQGNKSERTPVYPMGVRAYLEGVDVVVARCSFFSVMIKGNEETLLPFISRPWRLWWPKRLMGPSGDIAGRAVFRWEWCRSWYGGREPFYGAVFLISPLPASFRFFFVGHHFLANRSDLHWLSSVSITGDRYSSMTPLKASRCSSNAGHSSSVCWAESNFAPHFAHSAVVSAPIWCRYIPKHPYPMSTCAK